MAERLQHLRRIPPEFAKFIPTSFSSRIRYIRYVYRVTSKNKSVLRVLVIETGVKGTKPMLLVATVQGDIKRVVELRLVTRLGLLGDKNENPTLVIHIDEQRPLRFRTPKRDENPTHSSVTDIKNVINQQRATHGWPTKNLVAENARTKLLAFQTGNAITPISFLEGLAKEAQESDKVLRNDRSDDDSSSREAAAAEAGENGQRVPPSASGNTELSREDTLTDTDHPAVDKSEYDSRFEEKIDAKLREVDDRRTRLTGLMEQLKFDATSAPSLSTVEQAIEDASAIDDDEKLSLTGTKDGGFGSEHSFDDGQSFVPAGEGKSEVGNDESVASLVDVEIEDEEEEEEEPEEDSYEDDDAPMPANFSEASYRGNAQLAMIPKAVHALAASALPPGMAWDRLSDTVKLQVLQSVSSEEVMIYKDRTEPFGFRVASDMTITLVLPNTAAHRAGMDRLVGTVLTHINGNPIESLADITQDLPSPIRLIVIDPTTLCPPRCVTSRACVNCFEMLADDYVFCTLCGTHREGKAVVVGTARGQKAVRKQIRSGLGGRGHVVLSKNVEASTAAAVLAAREPPTQPPAINQGELTGQFAKRAQNLNRLAFLYLGDQDMVAEYFQSILDECESIKTTSSHGSDKAGRHGPGERRMWGKRGRVAAHPFSHVFDQLLVEKDDAAGEAERLSVYAAAVESGNLAEYWERYVTHLRIERNILKRFLVGCVRSKGATADPRRKVRRKRAMVARWLAGLPPPPPVTAQGNQTEAGPVQPSDGTQSFVDHSLGNNEPFLLGTSRARDAGQQASAFEPYLARHTAPQYAFGWSKQKPCFATSPDTPSFADLPILDQPVVLLRPSSEEVHLAPLTHTTDSAVFSP